MSIDPGSVSFDHYTVSRWHGGGTNHYGIPCFKADHDDSVGTPMYGLNPEHLFNENLPEGTRIKVTVEIVEAGDGFGNAFYHRKHQLKGGKNTCDLCPEPDPQEAPCQAVASGTASTVGSTPAAL